MYGPDGSGPAPFLYIGTTVPMIIFQSHIYFGPTKPMLSKLD